MFSSSQTLCTKYATYTENKLYLKFERKNFVKLTRGEKRSSGDNKKKFLGYLVIQLEIDIEIEVIICKSYKLLFTRIIITL